MSKQVRERRSAADWSAIIERQATSGLGQRDFCQSEGLAVSTFAYWKRKVRGAPIGKGRLQQDGPLFTPIPSLPDFVDERTTSASDGSAWCVDLDLGDGLRLTIRKVA